MHDLTYFIIIANSLIRYQRVGNTLVTLKVLKQAFSNGGPRAKSGLRRHLKWPTGRALIKEKKNI